MNTLKHTENFFYLDNGTIKVRLLNADGVKYNRTRWCHTGFIQDVWCNGIKFSEYEHSRPCNQHTSEGSGLCCQFMPIAPEEAIPGKLTLIPGVGSGIYQKPNPEQDRLDIQNYLETNVYHTADSATFETHSHLIEGYSYSEKREIKLSGNEIIVTVTFTNTGKKEIHTQEMCHNFLSLAGEEISPNYILEFPAAIVPDDFRSGAMIYKDGYFTFSDYPDTPCYFDNKINIKACDEYGWIMKSKTNNVFCYEKLNTAPARVSVWSDYYTLCPEMYIAVDLVPGETTSWQRTWGFSLEN